MSKVFIPEDRTQKQPVTCICRNPECLESSEDEHFKFTTEHSQIACPKCGADRAPMVAVLALVHFLTRDPKGPIVGYGGLKYAFACAEKRAYLATMTNQEAATGDIRSVNCPGCLKAAADRKLAPLAGFSMAKGEFEEKV